MAVQRAAGLDGAMATDQMRRGGDIVHLDALCEQVSA
jgi:hypothetical protein